MTQGREWRQALPGGEDREVTAARTHGGQEAQAASRACQSPDSGVFPSFCGFGTKSSPVDMYREETGMSKNKTRVTV